MKLTAKIVFAFFLTCCIQSYAQQIPGELVNVRSSRDETVRTVALRFETTRFRDNISNIQFWYKKAAFFLYYNADSISIREEIRKAITVGTGSLINHIDTNLHNNYEFLRYGQKIPFIYNKKPCSITLLKVESLPDSAFALNILLKIPVDETSLKGVVISGHTGDPIPGATIMISKTTGYKCDSLGNFFIRKLQNDTIKLSFSAIGYPRTDTFLTDLHSGLNEFRWLIYTTCRTYNQEASLQRIKNGKPAILLQSGESGLSRFSVQAFAIKYNVQFIELGETQTDQLDCLILFNRTAFRYLDEQYGKVWYDDLPEDIPGLKWFDNTK